MARIAWDYGCTLLSRGSYWDDLVMSALQVEPFFDEEAGNWHYRVPALHINSGGTRHHEDAECDCLSAAMFALEGDLCDYDTDAPSSTPCGMRAHL